MRDRDQGRVPPGFPSSPTKTGKKFGRDQAKSWNGAIATVPLPQSPKAIIYFHLKVCETTNAWDVLKVTKHWRVAITSVTQKRCEWSPMAKMAKGYGMLWSTNVLETGDLNILVPNSCTGVHQPSPQDEVHAVQLNSPVQAQFPLMLEYEAFLRRFSAWRTS